MRHASLLVGPSVLCAASMLGGLAMAMATGLNGTEILSGYALASAIATFFGVLIWAVSPRLRAPQTLHLGLISAAVIALRERWLMLIIPLALLPVFMTGFTTMKTAAPLVTGYHFDGLWANGDALLLGTDAWRITHRFIGTTGSSVLRMFYTGVWGLALALVVPIYTMAGNPARVTRAFTALMATWLLGGVGGTVLFSSVGPVFVDLVDPSLGARFAPFHASLAEALPHKGPILISQEYLRQSFGLHQVVMGGGVSAMPSMHLGVCAWLVLLAGKTSWRFGAIALWVLTWIGSVHFGYHYALDGIVGSAIAWGCWRACMIGLVYRQASVRPSAAQLRVRANA